MKAQINHTLISELAKILLSLNQTVVTAESCTGGWIAKAFTDAAGSSQYFEGGIVSYSNNLKQALLGVSTQSLNKYGAVSKQVVEEMATGAIRVMESNYAIAVSGIAGPDGGTPEKPTGTVWFAVANNTGNVIADVQVFTGNRDQVRIASVNHGLALLRQILD